MPARYARPDVQRNKNDAADAEAIGAAVTRPSMRVVPIKAAEQQSVLLLRRTRELLVRQRTMLVDALRGHRIRHRRCARDRQRGQAACRHGWQV